jgi:hypothetical protein
MVQLTPEQLQALRDLEDTHNVVGQEIARAESAGLDMTDYKAKLAALEATRQGLLKVYGAPKGRRTVG